MKKHKQMKAEIQGHSLWASICLSLVTVRQIIRRISSSCKLIVAHTFTQRIFFLTALTIVHCNTWTIASALERNICHTELYQMTWNTSHTQTTNASELLLIPVQSAFAIDTLSVLMKWSHRHFASALKHSFVFVSFARSQLIGTSVTVVSLIYFYFYSTRFVSTFPFHRLTLKTLTLTFHLSFLCTPSLSLSLSLEKSA